MEYDRVKNSLDKVDWPSVQSIEVYVTVPGYRQLAFGWVICAAADCGNNTAIICADDNVVKFNKRVLLCIANDIIKVCKPCYGIVYQRDFKNGPDLYAYGITAGLGYDVFDMKEKRAISKWMQDGLEDQKYVQGLIRDVYPLNILSEKHLQFRIGNKTFMKWVTDNPIHGSLFRINDSLWAWDVDSSKISMFKQVLDQNGMIICSVSGTSGTVEP